LPSNIRLGWKALPETNTLAYYENSYFYLRPLKVYFITLAPASCLSFFRRGSTCCRPRPRRRRPQRISIFLPRRWKTDGKICSRRHSACTASGIGSTSSGNGTVAWRRFEKKDKHRHSGYKNLTLSHWLQRLNTGTEVTDTLAQGYKDLTLAQWLRNINTVVAKT
jgi:hypothetical protein